MKKITFFLAAIILSLATLAQTPQAINYQAVARTTDGNAIVNQNITVKISILSGSTTGAAVYTERHDATTNNMGLFTLQIGNPTQVLSGNFETIDWGAANYFLKTEMDENGGSNFVHMGTSQLLSVPYALYSENTANPEDADADPQNELQTLSQTDYNVTLSQGGSSIITGVKSYSQAAIEAMIPYDGLTVYNSTTHCINFYAVNNWFEACGTCTPQPTQANAGNDEVIQGGDLSVYLNANTPAIGEGIWTILIGEGGAFDDATNPTTLFTGLLNESYTLQWEIYTVCDTSYDDVSVLFVSLEIGNEYQGGIIAYILQPGDPGYFEGETHGIIAAANDQSSNAQWGCYGTTIPGADGTALGTGYQNTLDIVAGCGTAVIAAKICNNLELNGFNDWYLPSVDELNKLYLSKDIIGGFAASYYWSSSEYSSSDAWIQDFNNANQGHGGKNFPLYVRAIRAF